MQNWTGGTAAIEIAAIPWTGFNSRNRVKWQSHEQGRSGGEEERQGGEVNRTKYSLRRGGVGSDFTNRTPAGFRHIPRVTRRSGFLLPSGPRMSVVVYVM